MRKYFLLLFFASFCPQLQSDEFSSALKRHGHAGARMLMEDMVDLRAAGVSWTTILEENLPKAIDDRCGIQSHLRVTADLDKVRPQASKVIGQRFAHLFGPMLSRPGATMRLESIQHIKRSSSDQVMVTLKVIPAARQDKQLSLLYELNNFGEMVLCDVIWGNKIEEGVIFSLGNKLYR